MSTEPKVTPENIAEIAKTEQEQGIVDQQTVESAAEQEGAQDKGD
jgi:hypothetical protein